MAAFDDWFKVGIRASVKVVWWVGWVCCRLGRFIVGDRGTGLTLGQETRETEHGSDVAVSVRGIYKLFGGDVDAGIDMAQGGASKDEIQEATGSVLALSDVSFDAAQGEIFVVMGLSGCGKVDVDQMHQQVDRGGSGGDLDR